MNGLQTINAAGGLTIGRLARAANVGVETIRYYQRRKLMPIPDPSNGTFRHYPKALVNRIRFIKRAQELGFTLDEIHTLLSLQDGSERKALRAIASARLQQIHEKLENLRRMEQVLSKLIVECEHTRRNIPCPIIAALAGNDNRD